MPHHYGADDGVKSTPIWRMATSHRIGAQGGVTSANNIEALRDARGWKRPELARRMSTTPQQVERLEKGQRRLTQEWMERAATALGVRPIDIFGEALSSGPLPDLPPTRFAETDTVEIMQLDLSFAMGGGTTIDDYIEELPVQLDLNFVRGITRSETTRLRMAKGVGESMWPTLSSGDQVMIDTTQNQLNQQDRIYAISLFGAAAIKRLRRVSGDRVLVISDNPQVENQEVNADDVIVHGRVVWFSRLV